MSQAQYILGYIGELASLGLSDALGLLAALVSILVISSVFSALRSSFPSDTINKAVGFCTSCALFGCVISLQASHLEKAAEFFARINTLMLGMIPATGVIYAMGGNITTALSSGGTLYLFLAFSENFCAGTIVPVVSICTAFALCASLAPSVNMRGFSSALKKCYVFFLGLIMTVLLTTLASQTALSSAADTVSARAAKLVASNIIPIVGGSVGETLRTLASSVGYIKNACGIGAILFIVLLVLPILVSFLLTRTVFILSVAVAELLGCERESKVLSEIGSIYGTLIAAICMVSVMFILALTLFVRCTVAAG
jgi:stage III sporulation protein AE